MHDYRNRLPFKTKVVNWAEPEARALVAGRTRSLCPVSNPDLTKNHYDCIFEYMIFMLSISHNTISPELWTDHAKGVLRKQRTRPVRTA